MYRASFLSLLLAACDVGSVLTGQGGTPDASGGGGGGGGGGGMIDAAGGGGSTTARLQVTFTTSQTPTPEYAPRNVVAVWIEGPGGAFVRTIGRWADIRRDNLRAWETAAGIDDPDAISGATRASHVTPLTVTWNMLDRQDAVVPDGTYTIRMELADRNTTAATQNNQGTFAFVKGTAPQVQNGLSNGGYTNVSIDFQP
jgi:hypothetical protein